MATVVIKIRNVFKYISCYSLSSWRYQAFLYVRIFKYISCYSLSRVFRACFWCSFNLNTSHVILYHNCFNYIYNYDNYLNTSHVILYRK